MSAFLIIMLSGCPDKEKSEKENSEQIPNTMEKASAELKQIITLLGGPMFDGRDKIEQMKNEQIQILAAKAQENPETSTTGSAKTEQGEESGGDVKEGQGGESNKQGGGQKQTPEGDKSGGDQEKAEGGKEGDQKGESEGKQGEEQKKEAGAEESGGSQEKMEQNQETPESSPDEEIKMFQFNDSLFGIPQWKDQNWKMVKVLADGMYFTWNNLQPQLLEKGVSEIQCEGFSNALEKLSRAILDKKIGDAQSSAAELYDRLSEFFSYYKTEKPPELQRVSSIVTGIHFSVRQNNWDQAQVLSNQLQQEFSKVKASIEKKQSDVVKMLEISLDDLRSAVQKQDAALVLIRTNLVTSNIQELDKSLSQEQN